MNTPDARVAALLADELTRLADDFDGTRERWRRVDGFTPATDLGYAVEVIRARAAALVALSESGKPPDAVSVGNAAPVSDPATDPVGTVRREEYGDGGYAVWVRIATRVGVSWKCVHSTQRSAIGYWISDGWMTDCAVLGAVPGTPAAGGAQ